jgi:hypothetical protein
VTTPEPGTVALVTSQYGNEVVAVRTGVRSNMGWAYSDTLHGEPVKTWSSDPDGLHVLRLLVVIDPEDRGQVESLVKAVFGIPNPFPVRTEEAQAALRAMITPPKPPEPTCLGAVVEDADGVQWLRGFGQPGYYVWSAKDTDRCQYRNIAAVKVLHPGWSGE